MTVEREARFLSGCDLGRHVGPFVGKAAGGLSYQREGKLIGVMQVAGHTEIYLDVHGEDDPLVVDSDALVAVTGEPSERELEVQA